MASTPTSTATSHSTPQPSDSRGTFTFGTRLGLVFITQVAFISAIAVGGLLLLIIVKAIRQWRKGKIQWPSPIHIYFISLLLADFIQACGAIFDIRWIRLAGVLEGPYCTAQGVFKQMGDAGVALSTMAIAFQTFSVIILRWPISHSPRLALTVVSLIWLFLFLIVGIGIAMHHTQNAPYYGNTKYWCWIRTEYLFSGIFLEYFWMWLAAFTNFILYIPVAVMFFKYERGKGNLYGQSSVSSKELQRNDNKIARQMLFYPAIYTITVLPISVTRFYQFVHTTKSPPFEATTFSAIVLGSSGIFNVLLFSYTRPALLPIEINNGSRVSAVMEEEHIRSIPLSRTGNNGLTDFPIGSDGGTDGYSSKRWEPTYEPWTPAMSSSSGRQNSGSLPD